LTRLSQRATIVIALDEVIMLAYIFVIFAAVVRIVLWPYLGGFSPLAGSLLFFGSRGPRRQLWIPLAILLATDVVLTKWIYHYALTPEHIFSWVWYAAILWLGTRLGKNPRPLPVIGAALASSVSFFLFSNFGSWISWTDTYPRTWQGLMMCYDAGLPFFRRSIEGDLLFSVTMFATPVLLRIVSDALRKSSTIGPNHV
jgi:uncharacterized protein DUF6580